MNGNSSQIQSQLKMQVNASLECLNDYNHARITGLPLNCQNHSQNQFAIIAGVVIGASIAAQK